MANDAKKDAAVTISISKNGSYRVSGPITLLDAEGNDIGSEKETVFLCRCGASLKKPFCDGSHKNADWDEGLLEQS